MKLNIIAQNLYNNLSVPNLKKFIQDKKISKPDILKKIRAKKSLFNIIKKHNITQSVLYLQAQFRKKIAQNLLQDIKAQKIDETKTYHNDTNLCGDEIKTIPQQFVYQHEEYIFDLRELYKNHQIGKKIVNPYTNEDFNDFEKKQIMRLFDKIQKAGHSLEIDNDVVPEESLLSVKFSNFYSILNDLHCYADSIAFNDYTLGELYDLTAQILSSEIVKSNLYPRVKTQFYNSLNKTFSAIPVKYIDYYKINNFYSNPYQNFKSNDNNINNDYTITYTEFSKYVESDKILIETFIKKCLDILITLLKTTDAIVIALIINENISATNDILLSEPFVLFSHPIFGSFVYSNPNIE